MSAEIDAWLPKSVILLRNYDRQKFVSDLAAGVFLILKGLLLKLVFADNFGVFVDGVYSGLTDAHLNDSADFWGFKTNKIFILTQAGNHDALHYGNLVTYLRLNGLEPSGGWF